MSEYVIEMIDSEPAKRWDGPNGTIYYKNVGLGGHPKPVSIGKKTADALKVGDTVEGTIIPTDYLTDKWKHAAKPQGSPSSSGDGQSENKFQRDVTAIPLDVWRTLIGIQGVPTNEVEFHTFFETVKLHANELLATIETVRSGSLSASSRATNDSVEAPTLSASAAPSLGDKFREGKAVGWADDLPPEHE